MEANEPKPARKSVNYVEVFIILAVLTAIEIGVTQLPLPRAPILIPLAIIKASLVALFYMHLRTDKRIFAYMFGIGLFVALTMLVFFLALFYTPLGGHLHGG